MSSSINYTRGRNRSGFTLVELLIGITVIGLLVGMLAVVGGGAISRAREFAVNAELQQMELAIEEFKTKYGFYPPSFEQFSRNAGSTAEASSEVAQLVPYLNRMYPNHQETTATLSAWWLAVGSNLDQRSSLVFWLSGLPTNMQYPLSYPPGSGALSLTPLKAWNDGEVERNNFYEFDPTRLNELFDTTGGTLGANVRGYEMEHGKTNGNLLFVYRDAGSYVPLTFTGVMTPAGGSYNRETDLQSLAYHDGTVPSPAIPPRDSFFNPNTFQLICFGMDGAGGQPATPGLRGDVNNQSIGSDDNLCNFAKGRLDKFIDDIQ